MRHNFQKCCKSEAHLAYSGVHWRPPRKVDAVVHEVLDAVVLDGLKQPGGRAWVSASQRKSRTGGGGVTTKEDSLISSSSHS